MLSSVIYKDVSDWKILSISASFGKTYKAAATRTIKLLLPLAVHEGDRQSDYKSQEQLRQ